MSTPRGPVQVVRQQWRSPHAGPRRDWEWLARCAGQSGWRQGTTAREAIRQAALLQPGKTPKWLLDAEARAQAELERA